MLTTKQNAMGEAACAAVALNYTAHAVLFPLTNAIASGAIAVPYAQPAKFVALLISGLLFAVPTLVAGYALARFTPRFATAAATIGGVVCLGVACLNWEVLATFSPQPLPLNNVYATLGRPALQAILLTTEAWLTTRRLNVPPPTQEG